MDHQEAITLRQFWFGTDVPDTTAIYEVVQTVNTLRVGIKDYLSKADVGKLIEYGVRVTIKGE